MRPLEAKRVILASHSETGQERFWPIRTEDLVRKWITVQTDTSWQPPGLDSWHWLNTVSLHLDRGSSELVRTINCRQHHGPFQLHNNPYAPETKGKRHSRDVLHWLVTDKAFRFNRKNGKIWVVQALRGKERKARVEHCCRGLFSEEELRLSISCCRVWTHQQLKV